MDTRLQTIIAAIIITAVWMLFGFFPACIALIISAFATVFFQSKKTDDFFSNIGMNENKIVIHAQYCGGHPQIVASGLLEADIAIDNSSFAFLTAGKYVKVSYQSVISASSETEKSLTASRLLTLGIFAFAFKKKDMFLKIDLKDDVVGNIAIIFKTTNGKFTNADYISQLIMSKLYLSRASLNIRNEQD